MNKKIKIPIISVSAFIVAFCITAVPFGMFSVESEISQDSTLMTIETKTYSSSGGLLPPFDPIVERMQQYEIHDTSDIVDKYDSLTNVFEGYDEMLVYLDITPDETVQEFRSYGEDIPDKYIHFYLSKEPISEDTTIIPFLYEQNGIIFSLIDKVSIEEGLFDELSEGEKIVNFGNDQRGIYKPITTGEDFDGMIMENPAAFFFETSEYEVEIHGFLTEKQVKHLAMAIDAIS